MKLLGSILSLGVCGVTIVIGACSSSSTPPPVATNGTSNSGGGGGSVTADGGGTATDGGTSVDGGNCLSGTFDEDLDTGLAGQNQIAGTVSFASTVAPGHSVVLTVTNTMLAQSTYADTFVFAVQKDSFTFRLRGLPDGTYWLQAQADVAGTSGVNDSGDLDGYFGGSTVSPIHTRADSTTLTVPECRGGTEFGIGPK